MRFAYIDSNGNEVPIPSVDALALRIELGAINENTELYDAQADQWGPAHSHEIFHTLSRTSGGDEGFIAPAPIAPEPESAPAPTPEPPIKAKAKAEPAEEPTIELSLEAEESPDAADLGLTLAAETPPEDVASDLELSLAAPAAESDSEPDPAEGTSEEDDAGPSLDFGGMDLAPAAEPLEPESTDLSGPAADAAGGTSEEGGFDFGDMGGGLELEETEPAGGDMMSTEPMDLSAAMEEPSPDFSGGMELETEMEFGGGGSLDLEAPMSDFSPDAPPAWMEQDGPGGGDEEDVMDFSAVSATADDPETDEGVPLRDRRTPRNKPSAPKHRRQWSMAGPIIGVVIVLAVGVGGYVAWPIVRASLAARGQPDVPPVVIPALASDLMPQMIELSGAALLAEFGDVRAAWASAGPIASPTSDWLAGVYLANASQFPTVETFWNQMGDYLDGVRRIDLATFDAAFGAELSSRGVAAADGALMRARADSSFRAGAPARDETYDKVEALVDGALALHAFLVANEANIEHAPASAVNTDPVLEVNPATEEISDAMAGLIDEVTGALADLNYLDLVTAEGLWAVVLAQVQASAVR